MKKTMVEMLLENNKRLMSAVDRSIETAINKATRESEERLTEKLSRKIEGSQKDTIDTLTELMHSGYNLHEKRIQRLEDELNLSPIKQKH